MRLRREQVREVDSSKRTQWIKLHFRGWSVRYDEWLSVDSPRELFALFALFELLLFALFELFLFELFELF